MKKVSVVVATYRRENDLKNALRSLAEQSCSDMEIVLVDDNDDALWNQKVASVVDEFTQSYPELDLHFIVNHPNRGSAQTRNIGIDASSGEFVTFLDDDDIYLPDKIKSQMDFMENGNYDYSITDLALYNYDGKEIDRRVRSYISETTVDALRLYHLKYHMTGTDTMMFRRDYLIKIGGFAPINVGDEFYLMQRAIEGGGKFGYLPRCDIKAYVHTGENEGISSGTSKINGENALFEYKKTFFDKLNNKDIRYIKMRHYAVLAFANIRMKKYFSFFVLGVKSFLCSPVHCVILVLKRNGI